MKKIILFSISIFISVTHLFSQSFREGMELYYNTSKVDENVINNSSPIDVTKSLFGKISGLNVYQGIGASPDNVSRLSFHGHAPLVLVDGYPRDINVLTSLEIDECVLLKDATAAALYGVRGANGVLLVTTKKGKESKLAVDVDYRFGLSTQFRAPSFVDSFTYANLLNSALMSDNLSPRYNDYELEAFATGKYIYDYPNVDWWKETMNDYGYTHNFKSSFTGGDSIFRYRVVLDYYHDQSMLKYNVNDSRYNNKPTDTRLTLRTNFDVDITKSTKFDVALMGRLFEINGSRFSRNDIFTQIYRIPSAAFPVKYKNGVYGGSSIYNDKNPVGLLSDYGHLREMNALLYTNFRLSQNLDVITKGLSASIAVAFDNMGAMQESSSKEYRYMTSNARISDDNTLITYPVYTGKDSETLDHQQGFKSLFISTDFKGTIAYDRTFGKHRVGASADVDLLSVVINGRNNSRKNLSFILNVSYNYANRYIINAVLNESGSAYLPHNNKFRTYPAVSFTWNIANEAFLKGTAVSDMRFNLSYGLSGWDGNLSHELSLPKYGNNNRGIYWGANATWNPALGEGTLPVVGLEPELTEKVTASLDLGLWDNRFSFGVDGFYDNRMNVLVSGANRTSGIIGIPVSQLCMGKNSIYGFDLELSWNDTKGDFTYGINATCSYMDTKIIENYESFQEYDYMYKKGNRLEQMYGYEVLGFFNDQMEINNSPIQTFSPVSPGDIKYKDQNGDNIIDSKDRVKMFGSALPRFYFGFGLNLGWKGFEVIADFQGLTGKTLNLRDCPLYNPLVNNGNISSTVLKNEVFWTSENKVNATMPRLTTNFNQNNNQNNSLWYRDGSYLKLRNLKVAYTFSRKMLRFADMQLYFAANNLFSLDNLHILDPEMLIAAYPSTRNYWFGLKFNF